MPIGRIHHLPSVVWLCVCVCAQFCWHSCTKFYTNVPDCTRRTFSWRHQQSPMLVYLASAVSQRRRRRLARVSCQSARPLAWLQSEPIDGGESSHLTFAARRLLGSARFGSNPSSANKICSNPVCMSANGARLRHKQDARDSLCLWLICRRRRRRLADKRARRNMIAHNRSQASPGNQIKTQPPASEFGSQCLARVRLQRSRREARSKLQAH